MRAVLLVSALAIVFAMPAAAVPVNPNGPGGIAAVYRPESNPTLQIIVLSTAGEVWRLDTNPTARWIRGTDNVTNPEELDPPVPVAQIAEWWYWGCTTVSGDVWAFYAQAWQQVPAPPFAPVSTATESIGSVKRAYR